MSVRDRLFQAKIRDFSDMDACWEWIGATHKIGYGQFWDGKTMAQAHRWSYERATGTKIPEGMVLDHICKTRCCVNPLHVRVVTQRQNALENSDGVAARHAAKTHCIRGHKFDEQNTYIRLNGKGRDCRECRRVRRKGA